MIGINTGALSSEAVPLGAVEQSGCGSEGLPLIGTADSARYPVDWKVFSTMSAMKASEGTTPVTARWSADVQRDVRAQDRQRSHFRPASTRLSLVLEELVFAPAGSTQGVGPRAVP